MTEWVGSGGIYVVQPARQMTEEEMNADWEKFIAKLEAAKAKLAANAE